MCLRNVIGLVEDPLALSSPPTSPFPSSQFLPWSDTPHTLPLSVVPLDVVVYGAEQLLDDEHKIPAIQRVLGFQELFRLQESCPVDQLLQLGALALSQLQLFVHPQLVLRLPQEHSTVTTSIPMIMLISKKKRKRKVTPKTSSRFSLLPLQINRET